MRYNRIHIALFSIYVIYLQKYHIALCLMCLKKKNEFEHLQEKHEELQQHVFQLESKLFMKMDSYRLVEQKSKTKCLTPAEMKENNCMLTSIMFSSD